MEGNNGSSYIDKRFIKEAIGKLFGKVTIEKLYTKFDVPSEKVEIYSDYWDFLENFEHPQIIISEEKMMYQKKSKITTLTTFKEFVDKKEHNVDSIEKYNNICNNKTIKNNIGPKTYISY